MDGWMHADGWMDACMYACMHVWSRVPCCRERELGGPYHWGGGQERELGGPYHGGGPGIRDPDSYIYIYYSSFKVASNKDSDLVAQKRAF